MTFFVWLIVPQIIADSDAEAASVADSMIAAMMKADSAAAAAAAAEEERRMRRKKKYKEKAKKYK